MLRRHFLGKTLAGAAAATLPAQQVNNNVFLERPVAGKPHHGKVLLALQAHSDDLPLSAAGTVAKLVEEGYTGYLVRATNDDMGDARVSAHAAASATTCSATNGTMPSWCRFSD